MLSSLDQDEYTVNNCTVIDDDDDDDDDDGEECCPSCEFAFYGPRIEIFCFPSALP